MNYGDAARGVFKRSRSREAEQIHEPQRERDTFNNDRKKKGNVSEPIIYSHTRTMPSEPGFQPIWGEEPAEEA